MQNKIVGRMANLGDSGQDEFVEDYTELAKQILYEQGISNTYLNKVTSTYIIAKVVTDLIEDGELSKTTNDLIATLRVNHPHSEDKDEDEATVNV